MIYSVTTFLASVIPYLIILRLQLEILVVRPHTVHACVILIDFNFNYLKCVLKLNPRTNSHNFLQFAILFIDEHKKL